MKKIKENINIFKNPISTIFGVIILIVTLIYLFIPIYFKAKYPEFEYESNNWYIGGGLIWSFLSIIAPDDFKGVILGITKSLANIVNKKSEN